MTEQWTQEIPHNPMLGKQEREIKLPLSNYVMCLVPEHNHIKKHLVLK